MNFGFTVDDVGYAGFSSEAHLVNLLNFLRDEGVRATFFAVPLAQQIPFIRRAEYIRILQAALADGHEVAQHGIEHDRFEVGIPPKMVLDLPHEGPARERLRKDRAAIEAALQVGPVRERLRRGRKLLEEALGIQVAGFRAPCLQVCDNLFLALEAEGYRYDSSIYLQPTGWDLLNGHLDAKPRPITRKVCERLQSHGKLRILPLTTEYTWYLKRAQFDVTLALAKHDFRACRKAGIPFVPICHVSPIQEGEPGCGFEFYRQLFAFARAECAAQGEKLNFIPLAEVAGSDGR